LSEIRTQAEQALVFSPEQSHQLSRLMPPHPESPTGEGITEACLRQEVQREGCRRELAAEPSRTLPRCSSALSERVLPLPQCGLGTHFSDVAAPGVSQPSAAFSDTITQSQSSECFPSEGKSSAEASSS